MRDTTLSLIGGDIACRNYVDSLVALLSFDLGRPDGRLSHPSSVTYSAGGLSDAVNCAIAGFLAGPDQWWLNIDLDVGFAPDVLDRLLAVADPEACPVVSGLVVQWRQVARTGLGGFDCVPRPSVLDWVELPSGVKVFKCRDSVPAGQVVRCAATGAGCLLVHRSVFERIEAVHGPVWFDRIRCPDGSPDRWFGPDVSFCVRAGACEIPIHVATGVHTSHQKAAWVTPDWCEPEPTEST